MKTEEKDWINLLAGKEVDGFTEQEKIFFDEVRQEVLKDDIENFEMNDLEIERERAKLVRALKSNNSFQNTSTRKKHFVQYAVAASVAMLAVTVTLNLNSQYPDQSPDYSFIDQGVRSGGEEVERLHLHEIKNADPKKVQNQLKKAFSRNDVQYSFKEVDTGWNVIFEVTRKSMPLINEQLSVYDIEITERGYHRLNIIEEQ